MARPRKIVVTVESLAEERERLRLRLAEIVKEEAEAKRAVQDAGREPLLLALERVKIPAMDKATAKSLAGAISTHGGQYLIDHLPKLPEA